MRIKREEQTAKDKKLIAKVENLLSNNLTWREIAIKLKCNPNTIYANYSNAKKRLVLKNER